MTIKTLKTFQERAIDSGVAVFTHCRNLLDAAGNDQDGRATAIHGNGYLLIEAPTGAGKTLMAGHVIEKMSALDKIVWFWFAPFKGVVDQSAAFLREQFHGLRLRTLGEDRSSIGTHAGDVFVTTWQLVATRVKDRRSVRQSGEQNGSVDELIESLRQQGFRVGVVVDEAHHGFHGDTQAALFFRTVLQPEYTILITATPDDEDLRDLQERMQIGNLHRITVSRADAVGDGPGAGLIKNGIKCIAWRADEGTEALVDFEKTALHEGTTLHRLLKAELQRAGINLIPLMLVQVDSKPKSVERAKEKLLALGFAENQIAVHTADEPDANLLALANDESREVLVFKMAVALGFDAPRAWALVSMRAARDRDFGVQLIGRILRVHRRLQGKALPDLLKYGYVMLADMDSQVGLDAAGQRINQMRTVYATVSPTTIVVRVGERDLVQSLGPDGQMHLLPAPPAGAIFVPPVEISDEAWGLEASDSGQRLLFANANAPQEVRGALRAALAVPLIQGRYQYPLRSDVPRRFKSQDFSDDHEISEDDCAERFVVSTDHFLETLLAKKRVRVEKQTLEVFTRVIQLELSFALPSPEQAQRMAQQELLRSGMFSAKELRRALGERLQRLLAERGAEEADSPAQVSAFLDVLLSQHPELLRKAQLQAMAEAAEIQDAEDLPECIASETTLRTSRLNVYNVFPEGMNSWETGFGDFLDGDTTNTVLWWHRNPPRKPWSINVLLESGRGFYPDFVIGIRGRQREQGGLLGDTKYAFDTLREIPKILAEHEAYGKVLILTKNSSHKWALARIDELGRPEIGQLFQLSEAKRY